MAVADVFDQGRTDSMANIESNGKLILADERGEKKRNRTVFAKTGMASFPKNRTQMID